VQDYDAAASADITISAPTVYDPITGIPIPQTATIVTQDGNQVEAQPLGKPRGLDSNAVMPLYDAVSYGDPINVMSISANGTNVIYVTCSTAHGLSTGDQISVQGLTNSAADGIYSVVVSGSTMAFTYQVNAPISASSNPLFQSSTLMVTALVGVPRNYTTIPLTGV
jgi:hypothetical protein